MFCFPLFFPFLLKARGVVSAGNKFQVFGLKTYLILAGDWVVFHGRYRLTCPGLPVFPGSLVVLLSKYCSKMVGILHAKYSHGVLVTLETDSALHTHFALLMGF